MNMVILESELKELGLHSPDALRQLGERECKATVHLYPASISFLLPLTPAERRTAMNQYFEDTYQRILRSIPVRVKKRSGPRAHSVWFECVLTAAALADLTQYLRKRKLRPNRQKKWYAVQAQFAVEIEGQTRGLQTVEERIILVKAASAEEAERKAHEDFAIYSEPYLNDDYQVVRWQFEAILDIYDTNERGTLHDGMEVFSVFKKRRLKGD
jgi:hypothetical protein